MARRVVLAFPVLIGVTVVTFVLNRVLPGDPARHLAGLQASPEVLANIRHSLGLDRPLPEQLFIYLKDLASGNLGFSWSTGFPVRSDLAARLPASVELAMAGLLVGLISGVTLGVLGARYYLRLPDHLIRFGSMLGNSIPSFLLGVILLQVFFAQLGLLPAPTGRLDIGAQPPQTITGLYMVDSLLHGNFTTFAMTVRHLVLPALALGLPLTGVFARFTRGAILDVINSDYVLMARGFGLGERTVYIRYGLRNALIPLLTVAGVVLGELLGGSVIVETIFSWPGVGYYAVNAYLIGDYAPVQGFVLLATTIYVLVNLLVDILYQLANPRVGTERNGY